MVDFSKMTDEELEALVNKNKRQDQPLDLSAMDDAALAALASGKARTASKAASVAQTDETNARASWRPQTDSIGRAALGGLGYGAVETFAPSGAIDLAGRYVVAPAMYGMDKAITGIGNMITGGNEQPTSLEEYRRRAGVTDPLSRRLSDVIPMDQGKEGTWARPVSDITELLPQAIMARGNMAKNAAVFGLAPGAAGYVADQAAKGTRFEPYAKPAAQFATALAGGIMVDPARGQKSVVSATRGASDEQMGQAMRLMADAKQRGINLTVDEALAAVSNGATTRLSNMRRLAENTEGGRDVLSGYTANRSNETRAAADAMLNRIGPAPDNPSLVPVRAQNAAGQSLDSVRQAINSVAKPYYEASRGARVPQQQFNELMQDPAFAKMLGELRADPVKNVRVADLPDDTIGVLDAVKKRFGANIDKAKSAFEPDNDLADILSASNRNLVSVADNVSPDYKTARGIVEDKTRRLLEPLKAGPLGTIANSSDVAGLRSAIIPQGKNVLERQDREIRKAMGLLSSVDGQTARDAVRVASGAEKNAAFTPRTVVMEGGDFYGGSRFANAVGAQGQQRKNFLAAVDAVSGRDAAKEVNTTLDALAATGYRPATGSRTAFNAQDMADLRGTSIAGIDATRPFAMVADFIEQARMTGRTKEIADFLTSGNVSLTQLMELRRRYPDLVTDRMLDKVIGRGGRTVGFAGRASVPGLISSDE